MPSSCAHDYEIQYTRKHPGKVAECPYCDAKFRDGAQVAGVAWSNTPLFAVKEKEIEEVTDESLDRHFNRVKAELEEKIVAIDNAKVVKAVATVNALTPEEYALVQALTERKVERVVVKRGPRKKKGLPEAQAEAVPKG